VLGAVASVPMLIAPMVGVPARLVWLAGLGAIVLARWRWRPAVPERATSVARALTAAAALYIVAMIGLSRAAEAQVRAAIAEAGIQGVQDVMIQPLPTRPLAAEVVIQTFDHYYHGSHSWTRSPRVSLGDRPALPRLGGAEPDEAIRLARLQPDVEHYLTWSRFPYWLVNREGESGPALVRVGDARYLERTGGLSGLEVRVP
jgi:hypothetical protein